MLKVHRVVKKRARGGILNLHFSFSRNALGSNQVSAVDTPFAARTRSFCYEIENHCEDGVKVARSRHSYMHSRMKLN